MDGVLQSCSRSVSSSASVVAILRLHGRKPSTRWEPRAQVLLQYLTCSNMHHARASFKCAGTEKVHIPGCR